MLTWNDRQSAGKVKMLHLPTLPPTRARGAWRVVVTVVSSCHPSGAAHASFTHCFTQRIQLRKEAVASVVNFRAVQNFHPVWIASVAVPKITGL